MLQRGILLSVLRIPEGQVPLAESAASGILPAEAYGSSFERQGAEGQGLSERPVDRAAFLDDRAPAFNEIAQLGMQVEILGELREPPNDLIDGSLIHRGAWAEAADFFGGYGSQFLTDKMVAALLGCIVSRGELFGEALAHAWDILLRDDAFANQALRIQRAHRRMFLDLAVEDGLRVTGVVTLVVPVPPVAEHVDDDVFLELLAVIEGELDHADGGFGVVAVHMEDGRLHPARDIAGRWRG